MSKRVKLNSRGRIAVRCMAELATRAGDRPLQLEKIAKEANVSISYLEQIFSDLRRAKLVRSQRGPGGGYMLPRPAEDIAVSQILVATERAKVWSGRNPVDALWNQAAEVLHDNLAQVSLASLVSRRPELRRAA